jgi:two-component system chemotaxis response regulator CheB
LKPGAKTPGSFWVDKKPCQWHTRGDADACLRSLIRDFSVLQCGMVGRGTWVVALGASGTEGLQDIRTVLHHMPPTLKAVVMVVLHRPWNIKSQLRAVLSRSSALPVLVARPGEQLNEGHVYIGEPSDRLALAPTLMGKLVADPLRVHRNRTVDLLFNSLAAHCNIRMIGVILSGSLDDGARGLAAINHAGGLVMAAKPKPSVTGDMPENAIAYDGPVDFIGSPRELAIAIAAEVRKGSAGGHLRHMVPSDGARRQGRAGI